MINDLAVGSSSFFLGVDRKAVIPVVIVTTIVRNIEAIFNPRRPAIFDVTFGEDDAKPASTIANVTVTDEYSVRILWFG